MRVSDYMMIGLFGGFGLWWLAFPMSVIRFYTWFHSGRVKMPSPFGVRMAGAFWIILMAVVLTFAYTRSQ